MHSPLPNENHFKKKVLFFVFKKTQDMTKGDLQDIYL